MPNQFEAKRFDLVKADKVRIPDYRFGRNCQGTRDVWIETSDKGERFLSQIIVEGANYPVRKEIYTTKCFILRDKATGHYWFLDKNDRGFWLHEESFSGAKTFFGEEAATIKDWLAKAQPSEVVPPAPSIAAI